MKAEILWCLNTIFPQSNYRSCDKVNSLFSSMFPDSRIAQDFSMAKTKLRYRIIYGIAPYYTSKLLDTIRDCNHFTVMFDESFNSVLNKNQMDVWIRYFDHDGDKMITRFLCCKFLDKASVNDIQSHLKSATDHC